MSLPDTLGVEVKAAQKGDKHKVDIELSWRRAKETEAEMIFIDYRLQAKLYKYARRKGVSKARLKEWIQYPRGRYEPEGVIRHFPNHEDHLHVRFPG